MDLKRRISKTLDAREVVFGHVVGHGAAQEVGEDAGVGDGEELLVGCAKVELVSGLVVDPWRDDLPDAPHDEGVVNDVHVADALRVVVLEQPGALLKQGVVEVGVAEGRVVGDQRHLGHAGGHVLDGGLQHVQRVHLDVVHGGPLGVVAAAVHQDQGGLVLGVAQEVGLAGGGLLLHEGVVQGEGVDAKLGAPLDVLGQHRGRGVGVVQPGRAEAVYRVVADAVLGKVSGREAGAHDLGHFVLLFFGDVKLGNRNGFHDKRSFFLCSHDFYFIFLF